MRAVSKMPRAEQWADRICSQLNKSVDSIIETGRLFLKAKEDLVHGEWERMFAEELVPFGRTMALRYMAIAEHDLISNRQSTAVFPPAVETLYALTKVPKPTLKNALRDGVIKPDMRRKAVSALMPVRPAPIAAVEVVEEFDEREALHLLIHGIRSAIAKWPKDRDIAPVIECLTSEARSLERRRAS